MAKTVCSPLSNVSGSTISVGSRSSDHNTAIVCEYALFGYLPCALCIVFKSYRHVAAGNGMSNTSEIRQIEQKATAYVSVGL